MNSQAEGCCRRLNRRRRMGLVAGGVGVVLLFALGKTYAGGGFSDQNTQDTGPPFFGVVRDTAGKPISNATITVDLKTRNGTVYLHSDSQGHFFTPGFDKSIKPSDIALSCSKVGYKPLAQARSPSASGSGPIEFDCVLKKE